MNIIYLVRQYWYPTLLYAFVGLFVVSITHRMRYIRIYTQMTSECKLISDGVRYILHMRITNTYIDASPWAWNLRCKATNAQRYIFTVSYILGVLRVDKRSPKRRLCDALAAEQGVVAAAAARVNSEKLVRKLKCVLPLIDASYI